MKVVVFLGPTMPVEDARAILDAIYLPPAAQSDVISALHLHQPDVIAIIDGVFGRSLSIWHKEILYALDRGIRVYGASSMGALRAAETSEFGTIGIGRIFEMYASQELTDDDEVVLLHGPADSGYRALSLPMINVRATIWGAQEAGLLDQETCARVTDIAKKIYYEDRILAELLARCKSSGLEPNQVNAVAQLFAKNYVDLKRQDAELLLGTLRDLPQPLTSAPPNFTFNRTWLFNVLYNVDRRVSHQGVEVPLDTIAKVAALHQPDFLDTNGHAANRKLVLIMAETLGVTASASEISEEEKRFRNRLRLRTDEAFLEWMRDNDLEPEEFQELMREAAVCRRMQRWLWVRTFVQRNTRIYLDELRLQNRYVTWARRAAEREKIVDREAPRFLEEASEPSANEFLDLLKDHLRHTECNVDTSVLEWAEEAGFRSMEELRTHLLRSKVERTYFSEQLAQAASEDLFS